VPRLPAKWAAPLTRRCPPAAFGPGEPRPRPVSGLPGAAPEAAASAGLAGRQGVRQGRPALTYGIRPVGARSRAIAGARYAADAAARWLWPLTGVAEPCPALQRPPDSGGWRAIRAVIAYRVRRKSSTRRIRSAVASASYEGSELSAK